MRDTAAYVLNLLVAGAFHLAAWDAGRRILPSITGPAGADDPRGERAFFAVVVGFTAFGMTGLLLGALGLLHPAILGACIGVPAMSGALHLLRARAWRALRLEKDDALFLAAVAVVIVAIPLALAPLVEHDDNVYHFAIPKAYLAHHRIHYLLNISANMPHLGEILYLFPMSVADFTAAKTTNLLFHLWTLVGLRALVRGEGRGALAGVAGLVYLSSPAVLWHMGRGYVEPMLGAFLLAAILAFLRWHARGRRSDLLLAGISLGAAAGMKYQGWIYGFAIALFAAVAILRRSPTRRRAAGALATMLVPAALLVAPWIVKDVAMTGNPIYPMGYRALGGRDLSEIEVLHLTRSFAREGDPKTPLRLLILPYRLVVPPLTFFRPGYSGTMVGLALLALALPWCYRPPWGYVLGMAAAGFYGWALSCQAGRYLVGWAPAATVVAMLPLLHRPIGRGLTYALAAVVVAVAALQMAILPVPTTLDMPWSAIFTTPRAQLLSFNLNYDLCRVLEREVPPGGKVLGMFENRFYFLDRDILVDSLYEAPATLAWLRRTGDPALFARELRAAGVTHVVVNTQVARIYFRQQLNFPLLDPRVYPEERLRQDQALFEHFLDDQLEEVWRDETAIALRLKPAA